MSFETDVLNFAAKAQERVDVVVRKIVFDMTSDIVKMTPVDTGHARSNYFWGVFRVTDIDPAMDKRGGPSLSRAADFASNLRAGGVVYLTNNLPYIMRLEFGSSKQAPAGMARITCARHQARVNKIVAELR